MWQSPGWPLVRLCASAQSFVTGGAAAGSFASPLVLTARVAACPYLRTSRCLPAGVVATGQASLFFSWELTGLGGRVFVKWDGMFHSEWE